MALSLSKTEIYALIVGTIIVLQLCMSVGIAARGTDNGAAVAAGSMWPLPGIGLIAAIGGLAAAK